MNLTLIALSIFIAGALLSLASGRLRATWIGPGSAVAAALVLLAAAVQTLWEGWAWEFAFPWQMPLGSLSIGMDGLSAVFVLLIAVVGAAAAVFGYGYLGSHADARKVAVSWFWYHALMASMALVVVSRDGFLFLMAWEAMSLASFFLVMHESDKPVVVKAGWIYLVATHVGTAFLLALFLVLGHGGQLGFAALSASGATASVVFVFAMIGFGTKAGLVPLHIWLPEAHPAAPSHVSALMSGVMIKTGIYGILRTVTFLGEPQAWWGYTLIGLGALSGVVGVLLALTKHDLKRLLAYHSVENIGIITLGLGIGLLGMATGHWPMAALGLCGGVLHVLNHGVFKSLLFLGAGSVLQATGTREIDRLGGLIKKMPTTAVTFLVGAVAISGLPPLNGFISEFLIYAAAFTGVGSAGLVGGGMVVIVGLAMIGGLAAACFTKAFGIVFLGEARTAQATNAREVTRSMRWPMMVLAVLCLVISLSAPFIVRALLPAIAPFVPSAMQTEAVGQFTPLLSHISLTALILLVLAALVAWLRARLLAHRPIHSAPTWDCGYTAPSVRMQYTASSFIQPILAMFRLVLGTRRTEVTPTAYFPAPAALHTHTPDIVVQTILDPAVSGLSRAARVFSGWVIGRTHLYILYIVLTLLVLLIWNLW